MRVRGRLWNGLLCLVVPQLVIYRTLRGLGMVRADAVTIANRNAELNALLRATAFTGPASLFLSIHTADPGNTGASEYTTYTGTRPSITFAAAASASAASSNQQDFAGMGATTTSWCGLWSATSGGTFQGGGAFVAAKTTASGDTLRFPTGSVTGSIA